MEGSYRMSLESGEEFDVLIPQFKLVAKEFLKLIFDSQSKQIKDLT